MLDLPDAAARDAWLTAHHNAETEAWLRIARRHSGLATIAIGHAGDVAIRHGWINVGRVEAFTAAGRMRAGGIAEVEAAKADGRWAAAYEPQRTADVWRRQPHEIVRQSRAVLFGRGPRDARLIGKLLQNFPHIAPQARSRPVRRSTACTVPARVPT